MLQYLNTFTVVNNMNPIFWVSDDDQQEKPNCIFSMEEKLWPSQILCSQKKQNQVNTRLKLKKRRIKSELWDHPEIRTIFQLYSEYGSQWKSMEKHFVERTANSIKNRFYTVVRTFLKLLFRSHKGIIEKLPHEIPSKIVLKFYEARDGTCITILEFQKFQGFAKESMRQIDYDMTCSSIRALVEENEERVLEIYHTVFARREEILSPEPLLQAEQINQYFGHREPNSGSVQYLNSDWYSPTAVFSPVEYTQPQSSAGYFLLYPATDSLLGVPANQYYCFI